MQYGHFLSIGHLGQCPVLPAQPLIHPRAKSRNPLSRPALRGGVARPGVLATPGLYPALKPTPRFSSAQAPYSSLCRLRQSSLISLRLLSSPRPLRWVVGWFSPHGRNTAFSCLRVHGCFPIPKRPHSGQQAVTRSFPAPAGVLPPAGARRPAPVLPAGWHSGHQSPLRWAGG